MIKYYLTPAALQAGCRFDSPRNGDAGYDIYASTLVEILPNNSAWVPTGLHVEIPSTGLYSRVGLIRDRSSVAASGLYTHAGVIDSSYRGEIKILMHNTRTAHLATIKPGEKIAQMIIVQYINWITDRVEHLTDLSNTERGKDGFGSTGK